MNLQHLWHFEDQAGDNYTVAEQFCREVLQTPVLIVKKVASVETILAEKAVNEFILLSCRLLVLADPNVVATADSACHGFLLLEVSMSEQSHDHGKDHNLVHFHLTSCLLLSISVD